MIGSGIVLNYVLLRNCCPAERKQALVRTDKKSSSGLYGQKSFCFFGASLHLTAELTGTPSGIRTLDPLIKSQLLYQLS